MTDEQTFAVVRQAAAGSNVTELCRKHGITETTFHRWRSTHYGVPVSDTKRFRAFQDENRRLKKLIADLALDNATLNDVGGAKVVTTK